MFPQVLGVLAYLESLRPPVVHRDIKVSNGFSVKWKPPGAGCCIVVLSRQSVCSASSWCQSLKPLPPYAPHHSSPPSPPSQPENIILDVTTGKLQVVDCGAVQDRARGEATFASTVVGTV